MPGLERMPGRVVEEHIEIAFSRDQASAEQRDRTSPLATRVAQRQRMANRQSVFPHRADDLHRLTWKSHQPDNAGLEAVRGEALAALSPPHIRCPHRRYV